MELSRVEFGEFVYEADTGRLVGPQGAQTLRPQVSRLLEHFLAHPDRVLDRASLIAAVWGEDRVVEFDAGLAALIKELRHVLGDSAANPRYLETIPRRGFRFLATPVAAETAERPAPGRFRRYLLAGVVLAAVLAAAGGGAFWWLAGEPATPVAGAERSVPRVAVLPFLSLADEERERTASLLLADSMIAALGPATGDEAGEPPFAVIGRTSLSGYPEGEDLLASLARDLGVDLVVEGSYRREGEQWLVNVSLVKVSDQTILQSRSFLVDELSSRAVREEMAAFAGEMRVVVSGCGADCLAR